MEISEILERAEKMRLELESLLEGLDGDLADEAESLLGCFDGLLGSLSEAE